MIRDLVVHLDGSLDDEARLSHAEALALRSEAHVTGVFTNLLADLALAMPLDGGGTAVAIMQDLQDEARRQGDAAEKRLSERMTRLRVPNELRRIDGSFGDLSQHAVAQARRADLFVASRPYRNEGAAGWDEVFESVLFEGGRGVYLVPPGRAAASSIERVLVAWQETREAARAVAEAMPLIARAARTTVLMVDADSGGASAGMEPGSEIARHLDRHRAKVEIALIDRGGRRVSDVILEQARRMSADLIVMGGYGHSRAREWVLGGVTREMLEGSEVPLFMSH